MSVEQNPTNTKVSSCTFCSLVVCNASVGAGANSIFFLQHEGSKRKSIEVRIA